jgi:hypothetical protein
MSDSRAIFMGGLSLLVSTPIIARIAEWQLARKQICASVSLKKIAACA